MDELQRFARICNNDSYVTGRFIARMCSAKNNDITFTGLINWNFFSECFIIFRRPRDVYCIMIIHIPGKAGTIEAGFGRCAGIGVGGSDKSFCKMHHTICKWIYNFEGSRSLRE